eukprot:CAMPEP_0178445396 /NCGR_PEP_ID=MMETSP0689_2-20121128/40127_1 /TAXON_ID=160604 /ORGANISM="Amphidinium massartii, Strain CS-259" /LENGTH=43 /DNA_ID= /DNA_START= /DNA_END= /DNA_ORIENTATION=
MSTISGSSAKVAVNADEAAHVSKKYGGVVGRLTSRMAASHTLA